jgi:Tfp pilus assembly protein PilZ
MIQVHLKMPREVVGDDVREWCFTGRVAHVESVGTANDKLGVGVQFLYYEVPRASL